MLVADGLVGPWDLVLLPDGNLLVTESNGALRMIEKGQLKPEPVGRPRLRATTCCTAS